MFKVDVKNMTEEQQEEEEKDQVGLGFWWETI